MRRCHILLSWSEVVPHVDASSRSELGQKDALDGGDLVCGVYGRPMDRNDLASLASAVTDNRIRTPADVRQLHWQVPKLSALGKASMWEFRGARP